MHEGADEVVMERRVKHFLALSRLVPTDYHVAVQIPPHAHCAGQCKGSYKAFSGHGQAQLCCRG